MYGILYWYCNCYRYVILSSLTVPRYFCTTEPFTVAVVPVTEPNLVVIVTAPV